MFIVIPTTIIVVQTKALLAKHQQDITSQLHDTLQYLSLIHIYVSTMEKLLSGEIDPDVYKRQPYNEIFILTINYINT